MVLQQYAPRSRLARSTVQYLTESISYPYAALKSIGLNGCQDILDVELELELEQRRQVPIRATEPVRIVFMSDDEAWAPRVLSRREDFPVGLVHTNLDRDVDGGLCLCIWEENWLDLASSLTGQMLIERIRAWFSKMADGTLHNSEQFLEPLIPTSANTLIIPSGEIRGPWHVAFATKHFGRFTLSMSCEAVEEHQLTNKFAVYSAKLPSQTHRGLAQMPLDLGTLQHLCIDLDFDLIGGLCDWLQHSAQLKDATEKLPILILQIPKRRVADGEDEEQEVWCYTLGETVAALGELLGATITETKGKIVTTVHQILGSNGNADLQSINIDPWRVVQRLDRAAARQFAGTQKREDTKFVGIGAGAIGSNVAMIATRSGMGSWTMVDGDILLPHNTVRQIQRNEAIGLPKATVLQYELDSVLADSGNASIAVDVFSPGESITDLQTALQNAAIAVAFSASPSVLGWLADQDVSRAVSSFFGPDGSDLVVLAESATRQIYIDEIEAQYFLAIATIPLLEGHLSSARMDKIRYANACQDLSRPLPPWQVHTLCGLAAGRLAQVIDTEESSACVWRLNTNTGSVTSTSFPLYSVHRFDTDLMRISFSDNAIQVMRQLRVEAGSNETGGVLIGTFDMSRNILHVVAALPAPSDSLQAPTYFIRGMRDLKPRIEKLANATAGRLHYIGEWHSHPDYAAARPSADDKKVFTYLNNHMGPVGSPYVMAICGKTETWLRVGWQERGNLEGIVTHADK